MKTHGFEKSTFATLRRRARFREKITRDAWFLRGVGMITLGGHDYPPGGCRGRLGLGFRVWGLGFRASPRARLSFKDEPPSSLKGIRGGESLKCFSRCVFILRCCPSVVTLFYLSHHWPSGQTTHPKSNLLGFTLRWP